MRQRLFTKNFILLILGQASSLFGNYILKLALSMYVLETAGSAAVFAGILSVSAIPAILLSPFGGILADRVNRRNLMAALDALAGASVLCALLFLKEGNGIAAVSALMAALSVLGAFETPVVQACLPQMQAGDSLVRGNAVINQVASVSGLLGPVLGGVLYAAFGLRPVMLASAACFFLTALLECGIRLPDPGRLPYERERAWTVVKNDFLVSMRFLAKEQTDIFRMLCLVSASRFFVMGVTMVGLPYIVRNVLGLSARHYGAAEGALAVAAILGSAVAVLLAAKWENRRFSLVLATMGFFILPAGLAFLLPIGITARYAVNVGAFCGMQAAVNLFSVFAASMIQQRTPNQLLGKVMAYVSAVTMCVQPIGQMVYGVLFDRFYDAVYLVLIPTGVAMCGIGLLSRGIFGRLE